MLSETVNVPEFAYVMACGPIEVAVCPFPKFQLKITGLFKEEGDVVLVNNIVDPAHTLIVPLTAAGIVVKLALCPNNCLANRNPIHCKRRKNLIEIHLFVISILVIYFVWSMISFGKLI